LRKVKKARAAAYAAAAIAIVTGILLIPTPLRIDGTLVLKLAKPQEVYAEIEGRLVELSVKDGDWVTKDSVIAKLSNPSKEKELAERQQEHDVAWTKARWYLQSPELENRAQAKTQDANAAQLEGVIEKVSQQLGKLTLIANRDGRIVGAPHKSTVGQWVKPGKPFCEVGDPHRLEAHLIIDQSDVHLIKPDAVAWVKVYGRAEETIKSKVTEIAKRSREEVPTELSNLAGGEVASKPDPKTGSAKPITAVYEVIIPIDNPDLALEPGLRGAAKLDGGRYTVAWWLMRWWNKIFNFQL
jgi:putative peptide zinc metalloprotease protein